MDSRRAVFVSALALAAALPFVVRPREAFATREYAKAEGRECAFCHIDPKGGGPRSDKGREYEANGHVFGVKSWTSEANERKYLRASSAVVAQWYSEARRLLDQLAKEETAKGGLALVDAARDRFKMFPRAWLGAAAKLLAKGAAGVPNAAAFLAKTESQFGGTREGDEAARRLDELAKDDATKADALHARAVEKARVRVVEGVTEFLLGNAPRAKELLENALADPDAKDFEKGVRETLARLPTTK